jgi:hypothetical protein
MRSVGPADVVTLTALKRADAWVITAAVWSERVALIDSSLDRVSLWRSCPDRIGREPARPGEKVEGLHLVTDNGLRVIESHGDEALHEVQSLGQCWDGDDTVDSPQARD